ncbi:ubiquitin protein ligase E3A isoform X2 [Arctopsyche grandis]|uniref:ubiquitin protein ligase E3A isoform X2 n=1 Tax=Arctopsyche grandis TaxID=121162 RepID=UPI00406D9B64
MSPYRQTPPPATAPKAQRGSKESSSVEVSSGDSQSSLSPGEVDQDIMKRAAARKLIERYFYQLVDGCGDSNCDNQYCASSGVVRNLTPDEAAAQAIQLYSKEARLCEVSPQKVPRINAISSQDSTAIESSPSGSSIANSTLSSECGPSGSDSTPSSQKNLDSSSITDLIILEKILPNISGPSDNNSSRTKPPTILTEESLAELCSTWESSPKLLVRAIGEVFSQPECLSRCFPAKRLQEHENASPDNAEEKESIRAKEKDPDKDEDLVADPPFDLESCRRAFDHLKKVPSNVYSSALMTALTTLCDNIIVIRGKLDNIVNCFLIAFEVPNMGYGEFLETVLPSLCEAADHLSFEDQGKLVRKWATHCKDNLRNTLESLQQLITIKVMSTNYAREFCVQDDNKVTLATKFMKIVYYANLLAGVMEPNTLREEEISLPQQLDSLEEALDQISHFGSSKMAKQAQLDDPLGLVLNVNDLDSRRPFIPFEEFYNETLSDIIEMDHDFSCYRSRKFSFMKHSFILVPATKTLGLYFDNRIRMYSERHSSLMNALIGSAPPKPYLRLKVRRDHLIADTLIGLELVAMERVLDFKKQLVVEFEEEQGVDEGGVSKEFFQLIVEEIFNPDYGMFTYQSETNMTWFNPTSFETVAQFTLIGIVLGLAIYNNIILAVNFPMVVYRKLMGKKGSFEDLVDWNPVLFNGLKNLLEYTEDDVEDVYMQTFRICYQDVFGNNIFHELKENGDQIYVTQNNKQEFVDLYADFLLNKSVECQFKAFRRGFVMVMDESPLALLFRPEEVEQLVCGSKNFDFMELELSTEYDGGYTPESQIIKDFWSIVHNLSMKNKKKLLQFTTGSDRVPVGGLSRLKLIIARNGPNSDRLPTAHTCFNVLLLPEYETKEKLNDRLLKAINYAKGFGML